jgi:hypothetical protein
MVLVSCGAGSTAGAKDAKKKPAQVAMVLRDKRRPKGQKFESLDHYGV